MVQQAPQQAPPQAAQPPDFLQFIQALLGPHLQAQAQLGQDALGLKRDAIFGRHLGMDGQPIANTPTQPLTFDQLRRNPADIAKAETQTFGRSFTAGQRDPGWQGGGGGVVTQRDPSTSWIQGPNSAWNQEPGGGFSMLMHGQRNPWSFGTMNGNYLPKGVQGPMPQVPRMF